MIGLRPVRRTGREPRESLTTRRSHAPLHLWQTARPPLSRNNCLCLVASLALSLTGIVSELPSIIERRCASHATIPSTSNHPPRNDSLYIKSTSPSIRAALQGYLAHKKLRVKWASTGMVSELPSIIERRCECEIVS